MNLHRLGESLWGDGRLVMTLAVCSLNGAAGGGIAWFAGWAVSGNSPALFWVVFSVCTLGAFVALVLMPDDDAQERARPREDALRGGAASATPNDTANLPRRKRWSVDVRPSASRAHEANRYVQGS